MLTVINRQYKDHLGRLITGNMPITNQGDGGIYILDYEVYFGGNLSYNLSFTTSDGSPIVTLNGANWSDFGISSGDTIEFVGIDNATNDAPFTGSKVVNLVNGNQMTLSSAWDSSQMYVSGEFYVEKSPQAVKSSINLIPNTQNSGLASFIDNSVVNLVNDDISGMAISDVESLSIEGDLSGSAILQSTIERLADRKSGKAKAYRLEIQYINWLYLSRFAPMFFSNECTTPFVSTSFLPLWNNPAVALTSNFKLDNDGNSGFRDENFNGNVDNFKVISMAWKDASGFAIGGIDYAKESFFTLEIENVAAAGFGSAVGLILFNDIEDEDVYSADALNNNGDYSHLNHTLFTHCHNIPSNGSSTVIINNGSIGLNGERLTVEVKATVSGNVITYEGRVIPNAAFTATFASSNDKRFVMLARVESADFGASNYSDTVNKTAWIGEVEDYPPNLGSFYRVKRPVDHAGNTIIVGDKVADPIIEDDLSIILSTPISEDYQILSVKNRIAIVNNGVYHDLYSYTIPLPQNYVGGYLSVNESIDMEWLPNFPSGAVTGKATAIASGGNIQMSMPLLINWRYFQSLPSLASVFGANATNDWLWYKDNGWDIRVLVETLTVEGVYTDELGYQVIRDYDDNDEVNWTWEMFRESTLDPITSPIAGERAIVKVTADMPNNTTEAIDYATVTVEGFEQPIRWLISSVYEHLNQSNSPLQPVQFTDRLKLTNVTGANNSVELEFLFDPSKISNNKVKFTGRIYQQGGGDYTERNVKTFDIPFLPPEQKDTEYKDEGCCDCPPELKLASLTSEELRENDITGVVHKNQTTSDVCTFEIYKDGVLLPNNGIDYPNGFPHDDKVSAFVYNWKYYLVNYGVGCYEIKKTFTIAGLGFEESRGVYQLEEYTPENAKGTARVLYQNNFETLWDESVINYADSGFEDSYRFRGMLHDWQPNVISESDFSTTNENRVSSIKSKDTYKLELFNASECHVKRLHKIVLHAAVWRVSDHNPSNAIQSPIIYECVLDKENTEQITYYNGSKIAKVEIILSKRQQNSVSLFNGSLQLVQGSTWLLPTISGGSQCQDATVNILDSNSTPIGSVTVPSGGSDTFVVNDLPCVQNPIGGSAMPLKTGQVTSYGDYDDGDTQRGRPFFTLPIIGGVQQLNHFGNKWRFTGIDGGYYDRDTSTYRLVDGTPTTRAGAYPNDLRCDWSTLDWGGNFILWDFSITYYDTWQNCIDQIKIHTKGGYSGWYVPNNNELISIRNLNGLNFLLHEELSNYVGGAAVWSSNTYFENTLLAWLIYQNCVIDAIFKTESAIAIPVRLTNINEL